MKKSNLRQRRWAPLLRKAGIPYLRLHDLRHTAATHVFLEGVHPRVVQERLGHANIGISRSRPRRAPVLGHRAWLP